MLFLLFPPKEHKHRFYTESREFFCKMFMVSVFSSHFLIKFEHGTDERGQIAPSTEPSKTPRGKLEIFSKQGANLGAGGQSNSVPSSDTSRIKRAPSPAAQWARGPALTSRTILSHTRCSGRAAGSSPSRLLHSPRCRAGSSGATAPSGTPLGPGGTEPAGDDATGALSGERARRAAA